MHAHWYNLPQLFTHAECDAIVERAKQYPEVTAVIGHGGQAKQDQMRRSVVRWLNYDDMKLLWFRLRIEKKILEANRDSFGYHLQSSFTELQFTEYHGDQEGHYDWHEDNSAVRKTPMDRKLSFVLQLSDRKDYEGGNFELHTSADPLRPGSYVNKGDALLFRSGIRHRVTPVTSGVRYSFVTWIHGPRS